MSGTLEVAVDPTRSEEHVLQALGREKDLAVLAHPGAAMLILTDDATRLLFASRAACALLARGARGESGIGPPLPANLRAFASRSRTGAGLRFERLALNAGRLAPPTTCACRTVELASGETGVAIALLGLVSSGASRRSAAATGVSSAGSDPTVGGAREPTPPGSEAALGDGLDGDPAMAVPHLRGRGTVRFLWEADAEGRFTAVSPALASAVGESGAAIVGRAWRDLVGTIIAEDAGVGDLFARGETWTARPVRWRIAGTPAAAAVDLAGMPVSRPDRTVGGFRGFGLVRLDALTWWTSAESSSPDHGGEPGGIAASPSRTATNGDADQPPAASEGRLDERPASAEVRPPTLAGAALPGETIPDGDTAHPRPASDADAGEVAASLFPSAVEPALDAKPTPELQRGPRPAEVDPSADAVRPAPPVPRLSQAERAAFRDIARALGARLERGPPGDGAERSSSSGSAGFVGPIPRSQRAAERDRSSHQVLDARSVLDGLPVGILIHRGDEPLFANRAFLDLVEYDGVEAIRGGGGVSKLFEAGVLDSTRSNGEFATVTLVTPSGTVDAEVCRTAASWDGSPASCVTVRDERDGDARARELSAILDTATDGVIVLDGTGRILSLNRSAEALFGYDRTDVTGEPLAALLAPESHAIAFAYLEQLRTDGVGSLINDGREVVGRVRQGGAIPLFMTLGRVGEGAEPKFCAVLRDVTTLEKARGELLAAKRAAETAIARRSDVLDKVSHELRTPLNAIIGFAEVMLEERFGPVGNERYRDYINDIHGSGRRVITLLNDLLDLARIEAGRMELRFASLSLNDVVGAAVAALQPQAARERIVVRTSFAPKLPAITADESSLRQIARNLVCNAVKFTEAGGQVIVSTAITDRGEVAFRVRDTGVGMTPDEVEAALEPFRTVATARPGGGAGLGLPLTRALAEANRASLQITSARNEGTLAEVLFPPTRVTAE